MGTFIFIVKLIFGAAIIQVCWKGNQTKNQGKELEEIINSVSDFTPTKKVIGINNQFVFMVDNNRKKIFYSNHITQKTISYNDIIKVEVIDNGKTIHQKSTIRTIGGAIVGGAVAGSAGAIVGGLSGGSKQASVVSLVQVKILLRDVNSPSLLINTFNARNMTVEGKPIKSNGTEGYIYRNGLKIAQEIADIVNVIIDEVDRCGGNVQPTEINVEQPREDDLDSVLREMVQSKKVIQSVKLYMDEKGVGLAEAKKHIDDL